ncbi:27997_t:CDS:1, partial [Gigaspora margarita]
IATATEVEESAIPDKMDSLILKWKAKYMVMVQIPIETRIPMAATSSAC